VKAVARTVVLDVDSTLSGIEGVDWLAERRGPMVAAEVRAMTAAAMDGGRPLEAVYGARLALIRPGRTDVLALAEAYRDAMAPGATGAIAAGHALGVRWVLVSGGLRAAILPMAAAVGIPAADVHAVDVYGDADGTYAGFDEASPLARDGGKPAVVQRLALAAPVVAVGDGSTDAELVPVVDAFWAFTGFAARPAVLARAARVVPDFAALAAALRGA
jgi:phosphoserine phosphatase